MIKADDMTTQVVAFNDKTNTVIIKSIPEKDNVWVCIVDKDAPVEFQEREVLIPVKILNAMIEFATLDD